MTDSSRPAPVYILRLPSSNARALELLNVPLQLTQEGLVYTLPLPVYGPLRSRPWREGVASLFFDASAQLCAEDFAVITDIEGDMLADRVVITLAEAVAALEDVVDALTDPPLDGEPAPRPPLWRRLTQWT